MPPLKWRVTFGHPRKGTAFTVTVEAATAGQARLKAREVARKERGHTGKAGTVRLHMEAAHA